MSIRIPCPWPDFPKAWIDVPETWEGKHALKHDEAVLKSEKLGGTLMTFAASLAILDNWDIPGLTGNPDKWDFEKIDLKLIAWVNSEVISRYNQNFRVPKNSSSPLPDGGKK